VIGTPQPVKTAAPSFDTLYWAFRHIQGYEAWQAHGEQIRRHDFQLGPGVAERFAWSATITPQQMQQHSAVRAASASSSTACWARMACCCCPARRMWRRC
jgi:amidase